MLMAIRYRAKGNVVARKRRHSGAPNEVVQIGVRLEERLRRRLERVASQRGQSMNAEIVERLERSFQSDEDKTTLIARAIIDTYPDIADRIEEVFAEMRRDNCLVDLGQEMADEERIEREMAERAEREGNGK
jgi:Arc-like DNA binding domain